MSEAAGRRERFPTTRWSLIIAAQKEEPESGVLNTLCQQYWYPVYAFTRRQGHSATEAEDLTQGFFARILEKKIVRAADRDRGRFRAFLLGSLKHFLSHEREHALAQKRGGHVPHLSLDLSSAEGMYGQEPASNQATPEQIFERRWALQLLDSALEQLGSEYQQKGKGRQFEVLAPFLEAPEEIDYPTVAAELDMTLGAARVAVHRLRTRFGVLIRALVSTTVSTPDLVDDEIRDLLDALSC